MRDNRKSLSQGFTLIEFIVVAVLIAIALIGILSYVGRANVQSRVNNDIQGLEAIISAVRSHKVGGSYGTGNLVPLLVNNHEIPTPLYKIMSMNEVYDQWGGKIQVLGYNTYFVIFAGIPVAACVPLVNAVGNSDKTMVIKYGGSVSSPGSGTLVTRDEHGVITGAATACGDNHGGGVQGFWFKVIN